MPIALIVEDEPAANQLLSMLVKLRGYRIESAFTGKEALKKVEASPPDVVFLDLMLPDINGYEVCQTLRDQRATNTIPVVMVTARLADENRLEGFRSGAVEYVPKPYTPDQIFQAMTRATTWKSRIESLGNSGEFSVNIDDEIGYLQKASDLRSLILSRTLFPEDMVRRIATILLEVFQRGLDWARSQKINRLATLIFQLDSRRIALTIHDESGWFRHDDPRQNGLAILLAQRGFDSVEFHESRNLVLTCQLSVG